MSNSLPIIDLIAAARPNFMKIAPLYHALRDSGWCTPRIVHTGQHYDVNMSDEFFGDLELPEPDVHLHVGSGSHAEQTAGVMLAYERVCRESPPDFVIVVGDVNSTLACAVTAKKLWLPVAHLEAGLRSRDRTMPEEINRIVTDAISDLLWTPSPDADENLRHEGVPDEKIVRVGNIMMDSFEMLRAKIEASDALNRFDLAPGTYGIVTLHRPSNVDHPDSLAALVSVLRELAAKLPLVFPVHPRTRERMEAFDLWDALVGAPGLQLTEPLAYVPFMSLIQKAKLTITDSGGIQEETTYLDIPCMTLRDTTERPITITQGTNRLARPDDLASSVDEVLRGDWPTGSRPELWDGRTAGRVAASLKDALQKG